jgi:predicted metal-dependent hydrolase
MATVLELGEIAVEVVKKDIKNIHLSVYPPKGRVRISAPMRMNLDTIRVFAISKLGWIRQRQRKLRGQLRESPREYIDRESHYVWGKRYLLKVTEADVPPSLTLNHTKMLLRVRPKTDEAMRKALVEKWYRGLLKSAVPGLIAKWEPRLGVKVRRFSVQHMKTKWGSCNPVFGNIRFNTELAKKAPNCLEYILVHEMLHLIVRHHDDRFMGLLNRHLPDWKLTRHLLNAEPLAHEDWLY